MYKNLFSTIFGAMALFAVVPAHAADEIDAAKVASCGACHGQAGEPIAPTFPIIWGQQANYLYKELHDYHSGDRDNAIMAGMAKPFSLEDLRKVANYFAAKPWPARKAGTPAAAAEPEGISVCKACHQPKFEGGAPAPRLAGLSYEYLISAMNNFAEDKRTNNLDMPKMMKELTPAQREAIAHYLAAL
jgi:cytochrome c553